MTTIETDFYSKSLDAKKSMNGVLLQDYDSYSLLKELIHKILMGFPWATYPFLLLWKGFLTYVKKAYKK